MSLNFGKCVRNMLLADATVTALLPGGIHPDEVPGTQEEVRKKPAAAYWMSGCSPRKSLTRIMPVNDVALGFRFYGATASQKQAAMDAIWTVVRTNRARYSDGTITIAGLGMENGQSGTERIQDGNDDSAHYVDFTITGAVGS